MSDSDIPKAKPRKGLPPRPPKIPAVTATTGATSATPVIVTAPIAIEEGAVSVTARARQIVDAATGEQRLRDNAWNETGKLRYNNKEWILNNSLAFQPWVERNYNEFRMTKAYEMDCSRKETKELFEYQKFIRAYLDIESPYRGILLYYGLGAGKTRASIEIARSYANEGHMCLFISKAKLISNFAKELAKWNWTFGLRSFDMQSLAEFYRLDKLSSKKKAKDYLATFGVGYAAYNAANKLQQLQDYVDPITGRLTNMIIIIDEVHNLAQLLHNGINKVAKDAENAAVKYYKLLMETDNCRFVTLSGTPIINLASELAILFNILRGPIPIPRGMKIDPNAYEHHKEVEKRGYFELFPTIKEVFNRHFIDYNTNTPLNIDIFQRRIQGLVSYYAGAKGKVFPELVDEDGKVTGSAVIVSVEMAQPQLEWYEIMRQVERKRRKDKLETEADIIDATEEEISSNFRVKSRMASNFGFPQELLDEIPQGARDSDDISFIHNLIDSYAGELLSPEFLPEYGVKMAAIINNMRNIEDSPEKDGGILIYSNYREIEGIGIMAKALIHAGYTEYKPGDERNPGFKFDGKNFAVLGSKDGGDNTQQIIDIYNSKENLFTDETGGPYIGAGRIVKILLGTESISEGIDLFNIRQVHILEPHWNFVRIDQTIGRARRVCSHVNLPLELWNFIAWIYIATIPASLLDMTGDKKDSTDQLVYKIAERKKKINDVFLGTLRSAAVDCGLNASHNDNVKCMILPPPTENNIHAYHADLLDDLKGEKRVVTEVKKKAINLGHYTAQLFHPTQFPELWRKTDDGKYRQLYVVEISEGNIKQTTDDTRPGMSKIYLYDREAAESQKKTIKIGYLLIKPNTKPLFIKE